MLMCCFERHTELEEVEWKDLLLFLLLLRIACSLRVS
jgi:hypothetical protein